MLLFDDELVVAPRILAFRDSYKIYSITVKTCKILMVNNNEFTNTCNKTIFEYLNTTNN